MEEKLKKQNKVKTLKQAWKQKGKVKLNQGNVDRAVTDQI
jgi:hypothetical protein